MEGNSSSAEPSEIASTVGSSEITSPASPVEAIGFFRFLGELAAGDGTQDGTQDENGSGLHGDVGQDSNPRGDGGRGDSNLQHQDSAICASQKSLRNQVEVGSHSQLELNVDHLEVNSDGDNVFDEDNLHNPSGNADPLQNATKTPSGAHPPTPSEEYPTTAATRGIFVPIDNVYQGDGNEVGNVNEEDGNEYWGTKDRVAEQLVGDPLMNTIDPLMNTVNQQYRTYTPEAYVIHAPTRYAPGRATIFRNYIDGLHQNMGASTTQTDGVNDVLGTPYDAIGVTYDEMGLNSTPIISVRPAPSTANSKSNERYEARDQLLPAIDTPIVLGSPHRENDFDNPSVRLSDDYDNGRQKDTDNANNKHADEAGHGKLDLGSSVEDSEEDEDDPYLTSPKVDQKSTLKWPQRGLHDESHFEQGPSEVATAPLYDSVSPTALRTPKAVRRRLAREDAAREARRTIDLGIWRKQGSDKMQLREMLIKWSKFYPSSALGEDFFGFSKLQCMKRILGDAGLLKNAAYYACYFPLLEYPTFDQCRVALSCPEFTKRKAKRIPHRFAAYALELQDLVHPEDERIESSIPNLRPGKGLVQSIHEIEDDIEAVETELSKLETVTVIDALTQTNALLQEMMQWYVSEQFLGVGIDDWGGFEELRKKKEDVKEQLAFWRIKSGDDSEGKEPSTIQKWKKPRVTMEMKLATLRRHFGRPLSRRRTFVISSVSQGRIDRKSKKELRSKHAKRHLGCATERDYVITRYFVQRWMSMPVVQHYSSSCQAEGTYQKTYTGGGKHVSYRKKSAALGQKSIFDEIQEILLQEHDRQEYRRKLAARQAELKRKKREKRDRGAQSARERREKEERERKERERDKYSNEDDDDAFAEGEGSLSSRINAMDENKTTALMPPQSPNEPGTSAAMADPGFTNESERISSVGVDPSFDTIGKAVEQGTADETDKKRTPPMKQPRKKTWQEEGLFDDISAFATGLNDGMGRMFGGSSGMIGSLLEAGEEEAIELMEGDDSPPKVTKADLEKDDAMGQAGPAAGGDDDAMAHAIAEILSKSTDSKPDLRDIAPSAPRTPGGEPAEEKPPVETENVDEPPVEEKPPPAKEESCMEEKPVEEEKPREEENPSGFQRARRRGRRRKNEDVAAAESAPAENEESAAADDAADGEVTAAEGGMAAAANFFKGLYYPEPPERGVKGLFNPESLEKQEKVLYSSDEDEFSKPEEKTSAMFYAEIAESKKVFWEKYCRAELKMVTRIHSDEHRDMLDDFEWNFDSTIQVRNGFRSTLGLLAPYISLTTLPGSRKFSDQTKEIFEGWKRERIMRECEYDRLMEQLEVMSKAFQDIIHRFRTRIMTNQYGYKFKEAQKENKRGIAEAAKNLKAVVLLQEELGNAWKNLIQNEDKLEKIMREYRVAFLFLRKLIEEVVKSVGTESGELPFNEEQFAEEKRRLKKLEKERNAYRFEWTMPELVIREPTMEELEGLLREEEKAERKKAKKEIKKAKERERESGWDSGRESLKGSRKGREKERAREGPAPITKGETLKSKAASKAAIGMGNGNRGSRPKRRDQNSPQNNRDDQDRKKRHEQKEGDDRGPILFWPESNDESLGWNDEEADQSMLFFPETNGDENKEDQLNDEDILDPMQFFSKTLAAHSQTASKAIPIPNEAKGKGKLAKANMKGIAKAKGKGLKGKGKLGKVPSAAAPILVDAERFGCIRPEDFSMSDYRLLLRHWFCPARKLDFVMMPRDIHATLMTSLEITTLKRKMHRHPSKCGIPTQTVTEMKFHHGVAAMSLVNELTDRKNRRARILQDLWRPLQEQNEKSNGRWHDAFLEDSISRLEKAYICQETKEIFDGAHHLDENPFGRKHDVTPWEPDPRYTNTAFQADYRHGACNEKRHMPRDWRCYWDPKAHPRLKRMKSIGNFTQIIDEKSEHNLKAIAGFIKDNVDVLRAGCEPGFGKEERLKLAISLRDWNQSKPREERLKLRDFSDLERRHLQNKKFRPIRQQVVKKRSAWDALLRDAEKILQKSSSPTVSCYGSKRVGDDWRIKPAIESAQSGGQTPGLLNVKYDNPPPPFPPPVEEYDDALSIISDAVDRRSVSPHSSEEEVQVLLEKCVEANKERQYLLSDQVKLDRYTEALSNIASRVLTKVLHNQYNIHEENVIDSDDEVEKLIDHRRTGETTIAYLRKQKAEEDALFQDWLTSLTEDVNDVGDDGTENANNADRKHELKRTVSFPAGKKDGEGGGALTGDKEDGAENIVTGDGDTVEKKGHYNDDGEKPPPDPAKIEKQKQIEFGRKRQRLSDERLAKYTDRIGAKLDTAQPPIIRREKKKKKAGPESAHVVNAAPCHDRFVSFTAGGPRKTVVPAAHLLAGGNVDSDENVEDWNVIAKRNDQQRLNAKMALLQHVGVMKDRKHRSLQKRFLDRLSLVCKAVSRCAALNDTTRVFVNPDVEDAVLRRKLLANENCSDLFQNRKSFWPFLLKVYKVLGCNALYTWRVLFGEQLFVDYNTFVKKIIRRFFHDPKGARLPKQVLHVFRGCKITRNVCEACGVGKKGETIVKPQRLAAGLDEELGTRFWKQICMNTKAGLVSFQDLFPQEGEFLVQFISDLERYALHNDWTNERRRTRRLERNGICWKHNPYWGGGMGKMERFEQACHFKSYHVRNSAQHPPKIHDSARGGANDFALPKSVGKRQPHCWSLYDMFSPAVPLKKVLEDPVAAKARLETEAAAKTREEAKKAKKERYKNEYQSTFWDHHSRVDGIPKHRRGGRRGAISGTLRDIEEVIKGKTLAEKEAALRQEYAIHEYLAVHDLKPINFRQHNSAKCVREKNLATVCQLWRFAKEATQAGMIEGSRQLRKDLLNELPLKITEAELERLLNEEPDLVELLEKCGVTYEGKILLEPDPRARLDGSYASWWSDRSYSYVTNDDGKTSKYPVEIPPLKLTPMLDYDLKKGEDEGGKDTSIGRRARGARIHGGEYTLTSSLHASQELIDKQIGIPLAARLLEIQLREERTEPKILTWKAHGDFPVIDETEAQKSYAKRIVEERDLEKQRAPAASAWNMFGNWTDDHVEKKPSVESLIDPFTDTGDDLVTSIGNLIGVSSATKKQQQKPTIQKGYSDYSVQGLEVDADRNSGPKSFKDAKITGGLFDRSESQGSSGLLRIDTADVIRPSMVEAEAAEDDSWGFGGMVDNLWGVATMSPAALESSLQKSNTGDTEETVDFKKPEELYFDSEHNKSLPSSHQKSRTGSPVKSALGSPVKSLPSFPLKDAKKGSNESQNSSKVSSQQARSPNGTSLASSFGPKLIESSKQQYLQSLKKLHSDGKRNVRIVDPRDGQPHGAGKIDENCSRATGSSKGFTDSEIACFETFTLKDIVSIAYMEKRLGRSLCKSDAAAIRRRTLERLHDQEVKARASRTLQPKAKTKDLFDRPHDATDESDSNGGDLLGDDNSDANKGDPTSRTAEGDSDAVGDSENVHDTTIKRTRRASNKNVFYGPFLDPLQYNDFHKRAKLWKQATTCSKRVGDVDRRNRYLELVKEAEEEEKQRAETAGAAATEDMRKNGGKSLPVFIDYGRELCLERRKEVIMWLLGVQNRENAGETYPETGENHAEAEEKYDEYPEPDAEYNVEEEDRNEEYYAEHPDDYKNTSEGRSENHARASEDAAKGSDANVSEEESIAQDKLSKRSIAESSWSGFQFYGDKGSKTSTDKGSKASTDNSRTETAKALLAKTIADRRKRSLAYSKNPHLALSPYHSLNHPDNPFSAPEGLPGSTRDLEKQEILRKQMEKKHNFEPMPYKWLSRSKMVPGITIDEIKQANKTVNTNWKNLKNTSTFLANKVPDALYLNPAEEYTDNVLDCAQAIWEAQGPLPKYIFPHDVLVSRSDFVRVICAALGRIAEGTGEEWLKKKKPKNWREEKSVRSGANETHHGEGASGPTSQSQAGGGLLGGLLGTAGGLFGGDANTEAEGASEGLVGLGSDGGNLQRTGNSRSQDRDATEEERESDDYTECSDSWDEDLWAEIDVILDDPCEEDEEHKMSRPQLFYSDDDAAKHKISSEGKLLFYSDDDIPVTKSVRSTCSTRSNKRRIGLSRSYGADLDSLGRKYRRSERAVNDIDTELDVDFHADNTNLKYPLRKVKTKERGVQPLLVHNDRSLSFIHVHRREDDKFLKRSRRRKAAARKYDQIMSAGFGLDREKEREAERKRMAHKTGKPNLRAKKWHQGVKIGSTKFQKPYLYTEKNVGQFFDMFFHMEYERMFQMPKYANRLCVIRHVGDMLATWHESLVLLERRINKTGRIEEKFSEEKERSQKNEPAAQGAVQKHRSIEPSGRVQVDDEVALMAKGEKKSRSQSEVERKTAEGRLDTDKAKKNVEVKQKEPNNPVTGEERPPTSGEVQLAIGDRDVLLKILQSMDGLQKVFFLQSVIDTNAMDSLALKFLPPNIQRKLKQQQRETQGLDMRRSGRNPSSEITHQKATKGMRQGKTQGQGMYDVDGTGKRTDYLQIWRPPENPNPPIVKAELVKQTKTFQEHLRFSTFFVPLNLRENWHTRENEMGWGHLRPHPGGLFNAVRQALVTHFCGGIRAWEKAILPWWTKGRSDNLSTLVTDADAIRLLSSTFTCGGHTSYLIKDVDSQVALDKSVSRSIKNISTRIGMLRPEDVRIPLRDLSIILFQQFGQLFLQGELIEGLQMVPGERVCSVYDWAPEECFLLCQLRSLLRERFGSCRKLFENDVTGLKGFVRMNRCRFMLNIMVHLGCNEVQASTLFDLLNEQPGMPVAISDLEWLDDWLPPGVVLTKKDVRKENTARVARTTAEKLTAEKLRKEVSKLVISGDYSQLVYDPDMPEHTWNIIDREVRGWFGSWYRAVRETFFPEVVAVITADHLSAIYDRFNWVSRKEQKRNVDYLFLERLIAARAQVSKVTFESLAPTEFKALKLLFDEIVIAYGPHPEKFWADIRRYTFGNECYIKTWFDILDSRFGIARKTALKIFEMIRGQNVDHFVTHLDIHLFFIFMAATQDGGRTRMGASLNIWQQSSGELLQFLLTVKTICGCNNLSAAWRRFLDPSGKGYLLFGEFVSAVKAMKFKTKNYKRLWLSLIPTLSRITNVEDDDGEDIEDEEAMEHSVIGVSNCRKSTTVIGSVGSGQRDSGSNSQPDTPQKKKWAPHTTVTIDVDIYTGAQPSAPQTLNAQWITLSNIDNYQFRCLRGFRAKVLQNLPDLTQRRLMSTLSCALANFLEEQKLIDEAEVRRKEEKRLSAIEEERNMLKRIKMLDSHLAQGKKGKKPEGCLSQPDVWDAKTQSYNKARSARKFFGQLEGVVSTSDLTPLEEEENDRITGVRDNVVMDTGHIHFPDPLSHCVACGIVKPSIRMALMQVFCSPWFFTCITGKSHAVALQKMGFHVDRNGKWRVAKDKLPEYLPAGHIPVRKCTPKMKQWCSRLLEQIAIKMENGSIDPYSIQITDRELCVKFLNKLQMDSSNSNKERDNILEWCREVSRVPLYNVQDMEEFYNTVMHNEDVVFIPEKLCLDMNGCRLMPQLNSTTHLHTDLKTAVAEIKRRMDLKRTNRGHREGKGNIVHKQEMSAQPQHHVKSETRYRDIDVWYPLHLLALDSWDPSIWNDDSSARIKQRFEPKKSDAAKAFHDSLTDASKTPEEVIQYAMAGNVVAPLVAMQNAYRQKEKERQRILDGQDTGDVVVNGKIDTSNLQVEKKHGSLRKSVAALQKTANILAGHNDDDIPVEEGDGDKDTAKQSRPPEFVSDADMLRKNSAKFDDPPTTLAMRKIKARCSALGGIVRSKAEMRKEWLEQAGLLYPMMYSILTRQEVMEPFGPRRELDLLMKKTERDLVEREARQYIADCFRDQDWATMKEFFTGQAARGNIAKRFSKCINYFYERPKTAFYGKGGGGTMMDNQLSLMDRPSSGADVFINENDLSSSAGKKQKKHKNRSSNDSSQMHFYSDAEISSQASIVESSPQQSRQVSIVSSSSVGSRLCSQELITRFGKPSSKNTAYSDNGNAINCRLLMLESIIEDERLAPEQQLPVLERNRRRTNDPDDLDSMSTASDREAIIRAEHQFNPPFDFLDDPPLQRRRENEKLEKNRELLDEDPTVPVGEDPRAPTWFYNASASKLHRKVICDHTLSNYKQMKRQWTIHLEDEWRVSVLSRYLTFLFLDDLHSISDCSITHTDIFNEVFRLNQTTDYAETGVDMLELGSRILRDDGGGSRYGDSVIDDSGPKSSDAGTKSSGAGSGSAMGSVMGSSIPVAGSMGCRSLRSATDTAAYYVNCDLSKPQTLRNSHGVDHPSKGVGLLVSPKLVLSSEKQKQMKKVKASRYQLSLRAKTQPILERHSPGRFDNIINKGLMRLKPSDTVGVQETDPRKDRNKKKIDHEGNFGARDSYMRFTIPGNIKQRQAEALERASRTSRNSHLRSSSVDNATIRDSQMRDSQTKGPQRNNAAQRGSRSISPPPTNTRRSMAQRQSVMAQGSSFAESGIPAYPSSELQDLSEMEAWIVATVDLCTCKLADMSFAGMHDITQHVIAGDLHKYTGNSHTRLVQLIRNCSVHDLWYGLQKRSLMGGDVGMFDPDKAGEYDVSFTPSLTRCRLALKLIAHNIMTDVMRGYLYLKPALKLYHKLLETIFIKRNQEFWEGPIIEQVYILQNCRKFKLNFLKTLIHLNEVFKRKNRPANAEERCEDVDNKFSYLESQGTARGTGEGVLAAIAKSRDGGRSWASVHAEIVVTAFFRTPQHQKIEQILADPKYDPLLAKEEEAHKKRLPPKITTADDPPKNKSPTEQKMEFLKKGREVFKRKFVLELGKLHDDVDKRIAQERERFQCKRHRWLTPEQLDIAMVMADEMGDENECHVLPDTTIFESRISKPRWIALRAELSGTVVNRKVIDYRYLMADDYVGYAIRDHISSYLSKAAPKITETRADEIQGQHTHQSMRGSGSGASKSTETKGGQSMQGSAAEGALNESVTTGMQTEPQCGATGMSVDPNRKTGVQLVENGDEESTDSQIVDVKDLKQTGVNTRPFRAFRKKDLWDLWMQIKKKKEESLFRYGYHRVDPSSMTRSSKATSKESNSKDGAPPSSEGELIPKPRAHKPLVAGSGIGGKFHTKGTEEMKKQRQSRVKQKDIVSARKSRVGPQVETTEENKTAPATDPKSLGARKVSETETNHGKKVFETETKKDSQTAGQNAVQEDERPKADDADNAEAAKRLDGSSQADDADNAEDAKRPDGSSQADDAEAARRPDGSSQAETGNRPGGPSHGEKILEGNSADFTVEKMVSMEQADEKGVQSYLPTGKQDKTTKNGAFTGSPPLGAATPGAASTPGFSFFPERVLSKKSRFASAHRLKESIGRSKESITMIDETKESITMLDETSVIVVPETLAKKRVSTAQEMCPIRKRKSVLDQNNPSGNLTNILPAQDASGMKNATRGKNTLRVRSRTSNQNCSGSPKSRMKNTVSPRRKSVTAQANDDDSDFYDPSDIRAITEIPTKENVAYDLSSPKKYYPPSVLSSTSMRASAAQHSVLSSPSVRGSIAQNSVLSSPPLRGSENTQQESVPAILEEKRRRIEQEKRAFLEDERRLAKSYEDILSTGGDRSQLGAVMDLSASRTTNSSFSLYPPTSLDPSIRRLLDDHNTSLHGQRTWTNQKGSDAKTDSNSSRSGTPLDGSIMNMRE